MTGNGAAGQPEGQRGITRIRYVRLVVLTAVVFVSFSAIFIRLSDAPALVIATWRMGLAGVMMGPVLAVSRLRRRGSTRADELPSSSFSIRGLLLVLGSGAFLAAHFASWITSLSLTSVTHSTVIVTMHPVIVIIASRVFLRERGAPAALLGSVGAIAGAVILSMGGTVSGVSPTAMGNLLAFLGALSVAGYMVIGRWARRYISAAAYNTLVYSTSAVLLLALTTILGRSLGPYPVREYLLFAALAFFCTILGHGVFNWALRYVPAVEISLAVLLEPVFASLMAVVFFREVPGPVTVMGATIILGSLAMVLYHERGR